MGLGRRCYKAWTDLSVSHRHVPYTRYYWYVYIVFLFIPLALFRSLFSSASLPLSFSLCFSPPPFSEHHRNVLTNSGRPQLKVICRKPLPTMKMYAGHSLSGNKMNAVSRARDKVGSFCGTAIWNAEYVMLPYTECPGFSGRRISGTNLENSFRFAWALPSYDFPVTRIQKKTALVVRAKII